MLMTRFASEPELACCRMVSTRSFERPSCRKNTRWQRPHKGAVRNSSGPALPWETPSARFVPMWWTSRSEYRFARTWLRAAVMVEEAVVIDGVWQSAQPMELNAALPLVMDVVPPGLVVEGVGGASKRINTANCATSLGTAEFGDAVKFMPSSGVGFSVQFAGSPPRMASSGLARSFEKSSLVTPISTL